MKNKRTKLIVRCAQRDDIEAIRDLTIRVYPNMPPYQPDVFLGQINNFPEGQFVVVYENEVVGYCATFRISEELALKSHTWREITGNGYASRHDPHGEYLYGMEVCVDPKYRGLRIGQRLYNERKKLCQSLNLKGIVFGGRLPGLKKRFSKYGSAEKYVEAVLNKEIRDPVLSFQVSNGFEVLGVLSSYLPTDYESMSYAAHLIWKNPYYKGSLHKANEEGTRLLKNSVRVATVQYMQRKVSSFKEFLQLCEYFVDVASSYESDFVVFPEWFTLQLLSIQNERTPPHIAIREMVNFVDDFKNGFYDLAIKHNINIIGGSIATEDDNGDIFNTSFAFLRDGTIHGQHKLQPTPNERYWWNLKGGNDLKAIETDCGPIGILICYDAEFPELPRHLTNQGVKLLFVPFCTDERQSYLRVRYCSQARAVENQLYVVLSGNVGNLPRVENMDIQYSQSCIFTPCDFAFARDGVAADTTPNVEMVAFADLHMDDLASARMSGTVQQLRDRRHDLYRIAWKSPL